MIWVMLQSRAEQAVLVFFTPARGDKDQWCFYHFSGLRQPSTGGIVGWGNIFEMRACIFGSLPPFLVVHWCSRSNSAPFPLPLLSPVWDFPSGIHSQVLKPALRPL